MIYRFTIILFLAAIFIPTAAFSQQEGCDGERYRTDIFTEVTVTEGIKFGENTTISGSMKELFMDIYEPTGDMQESRPAVVMAFGGAFVAGQRQDLDGICRTFARKGYVAVTIDYRLFDLLFPQDSSQMTDVVVKSVGDMKAAIRYLREDAATDNTFRIDPNHIFVGGVSAGAITAAHTAYLDEDDEYTEDIATAISNNGGFEGNSSDNFEYSSEVQGVINYSGALKVASYISADEPPLYSVHDDGDMVVPYGNDFVPAGPFLVIYLEGSQSMNARAEAVGVDSELLTIENSDGHVSYFFNNAAEYEQQIEDETANFLGDILCGPLSSNEEMSIASNASILYPNPASEFLTLQFESVPQRYSIRLYDSAGKVVQQYDGLNDWQYQIGLDNLSNGYYSLQVVFEASERAPVWHKLVVNKN